MLDLDFLNAEHARALGLPVDLPILRWRKEQRRLADRHGGFSLFGHRFRSPWMKEYQGLWVEVRFNPRHMDAGVDVYTIAGRFLGRAKARGIETRAKKWSA